MIPLLMGALLAGLIGSPHCIGMCGGFSMLAARSPGDALAWHTGRLTTYTILGMIIGAMGDRIPGPGWIASAVAAIFLVIFAANLAGLLRAPALPIGGLTRLGSSLLRGSGPAERYLFGLLTGLLPCGLVYVALGFPLTAADPLWGGAAMLAFGLGTVPALALVATGLQRLLERFPSARLWMAGVVLLLGLGTLLIRYTPLESVFFPISPNLSSR